MLHYIHTTYSEGEMMMEYKISFPGNRWVSEDLVRMWYRDAVANGEVEYIDLVHINEIKEELESSGSVTFTTMTRTSAE